MDCRALALGSHVAVVKSSVASPKGARRAARGDEMSAADAVCPTCGAEQFSQGARFCTKCGQAFPAHHGSPDAERRQGCVRRFLRALVTGGSSFAGRVLAPRAKRHAPVKYVWRSRRGVLRASRTDGAAERGRSRPEIFRVSGLSASAKKVYFYLSHISDANGYAFLFVRTIAARTHLSKATVCHALNELEQAGLLTRVHRYSRRGGSSNIYRLSPPGSDGGFLCA
jgi:DNA-binding transcriptional ArsR family regulator/ribosomal protein L32